MMIEMPETQKFLDYSGANYLWNRVETELGKKANSADLSAAATSGEASDISLTDTGNYYSSSNVETALQEVSVNLAGKIDKVTDAVAGNFTTLDNSGNLVDSGHNHETYVSGILVNGSNVVSHGSAEINDVASKKLVDHKSPAIYKVLTNQVTATFTDAVSDMPLNSVKVDLNGTANPLSGIHQVHIIHGPSNVAAEGETYTISFDEIYEGTLDVINGTITITKEIVDLSNLVWNRLVTSEEGKFRFNTYALHDKVDENVQFICTAYNKITEQQTQDCIRGYAFSPYSDYLYLYDPDYETLTSFEFAEAMNGVKLAYNLATPRQIVINPTEIRTLAGTNYIWCIESNIEVAYPIYPASSYDITAALSGIGNIDISGKADKTDTVLNTTLSRGRKDNTDVGSASLAFGVNTEASGYYSVALGLNTTAERQGAYAEGKGTVAHYIAHAEGENSQALNSWSHAQNLETQAKGAASSANGRHTIATGADSFVFGKYNAEDSYDNWPTWVAGTSYAVGDRVKRNLNVQNTPTDVGYHCKVANSDETFTSSHWELDGYHMNFVEIVGNGKEDEDPNTHEYIRNGSNARALDWNGNEFLQGDVYVGCNANSTGGTKVATINDILNKLITNPQDGQVLVYDGTAGKWVNGAASGGMVVPVFTTADFETFTCDKTFAEIAALVENDNCFFAKVNYGTGSRLYCTLYTVKKENDDVSEVEFSVIDVSAYTALYIINYSATGISITKIELASGGGLL